MKRKSTPKRKTLLSQPELLKRIYPPRAEVTLNPARLAHDGRGYIGQFKYNDVRTLIFFFPEGRIELLTRKREPHRGYHMSEGMRRALLGLGLSRERSHVIDGGILKNLSVKGERPIVIWDILVHDDDYLLGTTYEERYGLLRRICGNPSRAERVTGREVGLQVTPQLWLAPVFKSHFEEKFQQARPADYLEGLMLKDPRGKLERGLLPRNNVGWQLKVRKRRKDYVF